ncbi:MAG: ribonuclease [Bryobacterales bacterium]|jgi:ribonuclease T2|nr:ribonuclease [Bryobacterales bacterium]
MARSRLLVICLLFVTLAGAAHRRARKSAAPFDYYLLSLSWAPDFCAGPAGNKDPLECAPGRRLGFVVHGLWPQSNTGRGPENCGSVSPVSAAIITVMLKYMPGQSLIQHEWTIHGSCAGVSAEQYFASVRQARDSVQIPSELASPTQTLSESATQLEAQFAAANPGFPQSAFRATCVNGKLQEARICLDKNLKPRQCTASAGECAAPSMTILPPR